MILRDSKECPQGGTAWLRARLGIPTASKFDKILTPQTCKPSTQAEGYLRTLLAEWVTGESSDAGASQFMDRGTQMEPEARSWYAYERDVDLVQVGILLRDDKMVGASPDALVGDDGTLEIKCPAASTHIGYLMDDGRGLLGYSAQVQGALWLSGRKWTDILSYHPAMPKVVVRVERNEKYIAALDAVVSTFVRELLKARELLLSKGCVPSAKMRLTVQQAAMEDPF